MNTEDPRTAPFVARHQGLVHETPVHSLAEDHVKHPKSAFPVSADHLGTHDVHEDHPTLNGELGDVLYRVRIARATVDLWKLVAA